VPDVQHVAPGKKNTITLLSGYYSISNLTMIVILITYRVALNSNLTLVSTKASLNYINFLEEINTEGLKT
jgi:hypothetical protein